MKGLKVGQVYDPAQIKSIKTPGNRAVWYFTERDRYDYEVTDKPVRYIVMIDDVDVRISVDPKMFEKIVEHVVDKVDPRVLDVVFRWYPEVIDFIANDCKCRCGNGEDLHQCPRCGRVRCEKCLHRDPVLSEDEALCGECLDELAIIWYGGL